MGPGVAQDAESSVKMQYKGGNRLRLMAMVIEHGYRNPRWATARQYSEKGYYIRNGEHAADVLDSILNKSR